ncbi:MAG TPA: CDP-glucose 4,6-dehydratase [Candidatus Binatia bacterium]|jgi:CDP-glucose 4,6-dehydratase|nr:CDP-glucose 4,6-dehydratase [Candidatus Binatia bacterium]
MMKDVFANAYDGRTVLVTGHTGFKGSWLSIWLTELGAKVVGFSLPEPPTVPSNFTVCRVQDHLTDLRGDVRDLAALMEIVETYKPTVVFHLAAQPIVFEGVRDPLTTFSTNALGTINMLEAVRLTESVRALLSITTDKVYANKEWLWGYRENDRLGGHDPYSASKAMAELAIEAYRWTFFSGERYDEHDVAVASCRAGNVIGGGDFGPFRLVPDSMRALIAGEPIEVRNPASVRPWQLVLEPISGYLWLGARLLVDGPEFASAWNFGPHEQKGVTAAMLVETILKAWGEGTWTNVPAAFAEVETGQLRLSWEKAATRLDWRPVYNWEEAVGEIVAWFRAYNRGEEMYAVCLEHIADYVRKARECGLSWAAA